MSSFGSYKGNSSLMTTKSLGLSSYPDALWTEGYWIRTPFLYMFLFRLKATPRAPPRAVVLRVRSLISSINSTWKLVRNSNSQAPTQTYRIRNSEWGSAIWALTSFLGDADATEVWGPLPEGLAEQANKWEEPGLLSDWSRAAPPTRSSSELMREK